MKNLRLFPLFILLILSLVACAPLFGVFDVSVEATATTIPAPTLAASTATQENAPAPTATVPEPTPTLAAPSPTDVPAPTPTTAPPPTDVPTPLPLAATPDPEETILILEPGPGSRLVSPLHITGMSDSTFEQTLVVRIVLDDGSELALTPVIIQAELGQRGPFAVDIPFTISGERQAFIQVYATSARDGGITHFSSVGVTLTESGPVDIRPVTDTSERINIYTPTLGGTVSGGVAHVEGFALASFEQHLLVEVLDVDGNVIGFAPVTVAAPDLGMPGPFVVDVPYTLGAAGPGRIVVRDPSVVFEGNVHLASVEVNLEP